MNAYKEAWLANQMISYAQKRGIAKSHQKASKSNIAEAKALASRQKAQGMILKGTHTLSKYAAQSQMKGALGVGLRVGGRVGLRLVPIVGAAMLAYDVYRAVDWLLDQ
jgi:hypothetical protein